MAYIRNIDRFGVLNTSNDTIVQVAHALNQKRIWSEWGLCMQRRPGFIRQHTVISSTLLVCISFLHGEWHTSSWASCSRGLELSFGVETSGWQLLVIDVPALPATCCLLPAVKWRVSKPFCTFPASISGATKMIAFMVASWFIGIWVCREVHLMFPWREVNSWNPKHSEYFFSEEIV